MIAASVTTSVAPDFRGGGLQLHFRLVRKSDDGKVRCCRGGAQLFDEVADISPLRYEIHENQHRPGAAAPASSSSGVVAT